MIFESKLKRQKTRELILLLLGDLVLAAIVTAILAVLHVIGAGQWAITLLIIFLGLQGLGTVLLIIRGILNWLAFYLYGRKFMRSIFLSSFRMAHLPCPDEFERSPEYFIANVVENSEYTYEMRLGAAALLGEISCLQRISGHNANMRLSIALEDALAAYRGSFPKPHST